MTWGQLSGCASTGGRASFHCKKKNGLLVTIASTCHLVSDVAARLGPASYVLTGLLNQNPLESLFSLVPGKGDARLHPKPSEARYCVCNMLLMLMTTL